jgi:hypothetical protein
MLHIGVERSLVLKTHDAAEGIAIAARRDVRPHMGLQQPGDTTLEGGNVLGRAIDLSLRGLRLPLKGKGVKDVAGLGLIGGQRAAGKRPGRRCA